MTEDAKPEVVFGGYVNQPPYLEMRLRMRLTGTSSPSDEVWVAALKKLLLHLEDFEDEELQGDEPVKAT